VDRCKRIVLAITALSVITLGGRQGLVPRDTASLLVPRFQRSEVLGFYRGNEHYLRRCAGPDREVQASVQPGNESKHGGDHGSLSDTLGLPRSVDSFTPGHRVECNRIDFLSVGAYFSFCP